MFGDKAFAARKLVTALHSLMRGLFITIGWTCGGKGAKKKFFPESSYKKMITKLIV
jgi:hypothetical protein